jgi:elongation factor G
VRIAPIPTPPAVLALAVVPATQADDDKLASALHRLQEEDPVLRVERDEETHQTLLWGTGETHLAIAVERLERKFGVKVATEPVKVRYRETITGRCEHHEHTHKKQSGGHGQYARVVIDVEPLERGGGFEFVDKIVGGAIGKGYIPAVQRGIEEAMASGGPHGHPVVDVRVTLVDGKEHSVDSNEMAFRQAGRTAFQEAIALAGPVVLEPISDVDVVVPDGLLGDVLGDLNARRGRVLGTSPGDPGEQEVAAQVPESQIQRYASELRSLTGGRGRFTARHSHYDVVPTTP